MTDPEKKPTVLTPRVIAQAQAMWETGEYATKGEIAVKLGVNKATLAPHLKLADKGKAVSKVKAATTSALASAAATDATILHQRQKETKEEHYKMATAISKLTWQEILDARTAKTPMAIISGNLKALEIAMSVLKKAREERFAVLGLNDENANDDGEMPQLVISELSEDEIAEMREAQEEEDLMALEAPKPEDPEEGIVDTTDEDDEPGD